MNEIRIDHSERDRARRFKILEGVGWDLDKAQNLLCWVNTGLTVREVKETYNPIVERTPDE